LKTYKIAIVGAGPSGYFSALALQNLESESLHFKIDLFERLPTPYGLVRSGVAPDHPKIKSVAKVFEKISDHVRFRLVANVEIGRDISLEALKKHYDAVVLAVGTSKGRSLGIPGENLSNSWSSAEFVPWYNGHPDFQNLQVDLSGKRAVVVGAGNVALDIARILTISAEELKSTDISTKALNALFNSNLEEIRVVCRRGPEKVAFTTPELRELEKLEGFNISMGSVDLREITLLMQKIDDKHEKAKLDFFHAVASRPLVANRKTLKFCFNQRPIRLEGTNKVETVVLSGMESEEKVHAELVVSAIGYEIEKSLGLTSEGSRFRNVDGEISENLYVVGWAKRGPSGVIGTNKSDAAEVMHRLTASLEKRDPKMGLGELPALQDLPVVDLEGWRRIDEKERMRGENEGRIRSKIYEIDELLAVSSAPSR